MDLALWGIPATYLWLMLATAVIGIIGFWRPVAFFNVVYPFAVVAMALIIGVVHAASVPVAVVAQLLLLTVWGLRLGVFVLRRERSQSYHIHHQNAGYSPLPMSVRPALWLMVILLYPAMVSPALFGAVDGSTPGAVGTIVQWAGLALMAAGVVLEAVADRQKAMAKAAAPNALVTGGLYGWVRCPNYFGEIVVWLGNLVVGAVYLTTLGRGLVAIIGFSMLLFIMLGATKRLESQQARRYGENRDHRAWVRKVPILFPATPIHSFKGLRVPEL